MCVMIVYATSCGQTHVKSLTGLREEPKKSSLTRTKIENIVQYLGPNFTDTGKEPWYEPFSHPHGTHICQKLDGILLYRYHDTDYLRGL